MSEDEKRGGRLLRRPPGGLPVKEINVHAYIAARRLLLARADAASAAEDAARLASPQANNGSLLQGAKNTKHRIGQSLATRKLLNRAPPQNELPAFPNRDSWQGPPEAAFPFSRGVTFTIQQMAYGETITDTLVYRATPASQKVSKERTSRRTRSGWSEVAHSSEYGLPSRDEGD